MPNPPPSGGPVLAPAARATSAWAVFVAFLRLGLTSFGGPIAHLGYFRAEFVQRRRWLGEEAYADLVALCQFLPGPASSQVGMVLGLQRAGWRGGLAAWAGFTLPSAMVMIAFGLGFTRFGGWAGSAWIDGLQIAAVAVVAQAVWGMAGKLCVGPARAGIGVATLLLSLALAGSAVVQLAAIGLGAVLGRGLLPLTSAQASPAHSDAGQSGVSRRAGCVALVGCAALLAVLAAAAVASGSSTLAALASLARAGALVFGGGHVVLPLLHDTAVTSGLVSESDFLAGYGAAQALPGPLFTFAAFLGTRAPGPLQGWVGGLVWTAVIFVPPLLLAAGALPFWQSLRTRPNAQRVLAGVNAAVVGLLAAALVGPVWAGAVHGAADALLALAGFALLVAGKAPPLLVIVLTVLLAVLFAR